MSGTVQVTAALWVFFLCLPPSPHGHAGPQSGQRDGAEEVKPAASPSLVETELPAIVSQAYFVCYKCISWLPDVCF